MTMLKSQTLNLAMHGYTVMNRCEFKSYID